ncbi:MAG: DNA primase [Acidimicrobiales bacterium]|jgi:DNA primase|nr:DNA primase [Acidimicrobiales bacterium]|tara:strand:+ start:132 stop:1904 length:1773 start_codon:yes stop_codon:yes gene_type:complete
MGIMDDDIRRVREESDIIRLITQHTQLKKVGRSWKGLCPFHNEKTPSFTVNQENGRYYCFGCQAKGDSIEFLREIDSLDFVAAVEILAAQNGIPLRYTDKQESKSRNRRKELVELVSQAVDFYHEKLIDMENPDARPAREYLKQRGLGGDIAEKFSIGWASDSWDSLCKHLAVSNEDLLASGLGGINKNGGQYDFFRNRILFPIFSEQGDPIAFGGRKLPDGEGPKYKNTSDGAEIYSKSQILYGLNWAKEEAGRIDELVVCEGYTDVIGCHEAGISRAVATCGTALTQEHVRKMSRFAKKVVLAFDADNAGQSAAEKVYEWESEFDVLFKVADLPEGQDPGDLAFSNPDDLKQIIDTAKPHMQFRVDRVLKKGDFESKEGRAKVAIEAMKVVAQHPDELIRDQYIVQIADKCLIAADEIRRRASKENPGTEKNAKNREVVEVAQEKLTTEYQALRMLIHRSEEVRDWLHPVLFSDPLAENIFIALTNSTDLHEANQSLGVEESDLIGRLSVQEAEDDKPLGVFSRLLSLAAERKAVEFESLARQSGELSEYQEDISYLRRSVMELNEEGIHQIEEGMQLRSWLIEKAEV